MPREPQPGKKKKRLCTTFFRRNSREKNSSVYLFVKSVRKGLESDRVDDLLVVHELVTLVVGKRVQFIVLGISKNLVGFHHLGLVRLALRIPDLIQYTGLHDVILQLGFSFTVRSEGTEFTFHLSLVSIVPIILRGHGEFHDIVVSFQFNCEVPEEVFEHGFGRLAVIDRVCVEAEYSFPQQLQCFIQTVGPNRW